MAASLAGRDHCCSLSSYTSSNRDFAACRATLRASTDDWRYMGLGGSAGRFRSKHGSSDASKCDSESGARDSHLHTKKACSSNADVRPARNYLQVARAQEQPWSFAASPKPLVCIGAENFLPGCPHLLSDVALDDAGQAHTGGLQLCAEILVRVTDAEPEQPSHEQERGVRIAFTCRDALESPRARLVWVLSKESLPSRLRPGTLLRVIAKPHVWRRLHSALAGIASFPLFRRGYEALREKAAVAGDFKHSLGR